MRMLVWRSHFEKHGAVDSNQPSLLTRSFSREAGSHLDYSRISRSVPPKPEYTSESDGQCVKHAQSSMPATLFHRDGIWNFVVLKKKNKTAQGFWCTALLEDDCPCLIFLRPPTGSLHSLFLWLSSSTYCVHLDCHNHLNVSFIQRNTSPEKASGGWSEVY